MVTSWLMGIVGMVLIGVIIDLIMSSGKLSSFVKSMYAMITLFVIVSPLPDLISSMENVPSEQAQVQIDQSLIKEINVQRSQQIKQAISNALVMSGYENVQIDVKVDLNSENLQIENIALNTSSIVLQDGVSSINLEQTLTSIVLAAVNVDKGVITIL